MRAKLQVPRLKPDPRPEPAMMGACQSGGCGGGPAPRLPPPPTFSEVRVNGVDIDPEAIAQEIQHHPAPDADTAWTEATRALVVRELLLQEARRLRLDPEPEADEAGRMESDEDGVIAALLDAEVVPQDPDEAECLRYYEANCARFRTPDLFEASHILIEPDSGDADAWSAAGVTARNIAREVGDNAAAFAVAAIGFDQDMRRLEQVGGAEPGAVRLVIAQALGLVRVLRHHFSIEQRGDHAVLVALHPACLVRLGFGIESESPRLLQQEFAHDERAGGLGPGRVGVGRRMVLDLLCDGLRVDVDPVHADFGKGRRRRQPRRGPAAAAAGLAGAHHRRFRPGIGLQARNLQLCTHDPTPRSRQPAALPSRCRSSPPLRDWPGDCVAARLGDATARSDSPAEAGTRSARSRHAPAG